MFNQIIQVLLPQKLEELNIKYELISHPPIPTIEEAMVYWKDLKGIHCKNLFMRNHKGDKHYLILFDAQMQIAIHDLEKILKQGKLSFASPQRMEKYLGVEPDVAKVSASFARLTSFPTALKSDTSPPCITAIPAES